MRDGATTEVEKVFFRWNLRQVVKDRIRETIGAVLDEELCEAQGTPKWGRTASRRG